MNQNPIAAALTAAVIVAGSLCSQAAIAATPEKAADKTRTPQTVPATTPPGTVGIDEMDDTTQKQHGKVETKATAGTSATPSGSSEVRNWAAIDADKDHSISPVEMEAYLVAAQAKSSGK